MATSKQIKKDLVFGWIYFVLFIVLILAGVVAKRLYAQADWVVFFHLPAAIFLVMGWRKLSYRVRERYDEAVQREY